MFNNLTQTKKLINVGDTVVIRKPIEGIEQVRNVTKKNSTSISTYNPEISNWKGGKGSDIQLLWQKAKDTRIIDNKVQFLANEETCDKWKVEDLKELGLDYWLELEYLN